LQQVVWNLLSNGIKFTPRDGHVKVAVSRPGSHVQITVSDNGEGVDAAALPRLFDRYRQGSDGVSRRHGGLGLGLAIVKHLVELHGGSVHARSQGPGKGASFTVLLPVRAGEPVSGGSSRNGEAEAPMLNGLSAIVVDDEADALELVRRILVERGARVMTASSGAEALERLAKSRPEVLISDIGMPGMDGYALIRAVRERWPESIQGMPAIALTAFARPDDRSRALAAGFQAHLAKPVEATELVAAVAQLRQRMPA
jgi:CheY-like chemotaxis protein